MASDVTALLLAWSQGDRGALERLMPLVICAQLAKAAPRDADRQDRLASSHIDLSYLTSGTQEDLDHAQAGVAIAGRIASAQPANVRYQRRLANAHFAEGVLLVQAGDTAGAVGAFARRPPTGEPRRPRTARPGPCWRTCRGEDRSSVPAPSCPPECRKDSIDASAHWQSVDLEPHDLIMGLSTGRLGACPSHARHAPDIAACGGRTPRILKEISREARLLGARFPLPRRAPRRNQP